MMMMTSPAETASTPATPPIVKPANTTIKVDIVKHRFFNLGLSTILLIPGLFFMIQTMITTPNHTPIRLGIDFVGGTLLEYQFEKPLLPAQLPQLNNALATAGLQNPVVQLQQKIAYTGMFEMAQRQRAGMLTPRSLVRSQFLNKQRKL